MIFGPYPMPPPLDPPMLLPTASWLWHNSCVQRHQGETFILFFFFFVVFNFFCGHYLCCGHHFCCGHHCTFPTVVDPPMVVPTAAWLWHNSCVQRHQGETFVLFYIIFFLLWLFLLWSLSLLWSSFLLWSSLHISYCG